MAQQCGHRHPDPHRQWALPQYPLEEKSLLRALVTEFDRDDHRRFPVQYALVLAMVA